jgi:hypothetical protein
MIPFGLMPSGRDLTWIPSYNSDAPDVEVPAGTINGVNANFVVSRAFTVIAVYLNGLKLKNTVGYTISGTTITFLTGYIPEVGDTVEVEIW